MHRRLFLVCPLEPGNLATGLTTFHQSSVQLLRTNKLLYQEKLYIAKAWPLSLNHRRIVSFIRSFDVAFSAQSRGILINLQCAG